MRIGVPIDSGNKEEAETDDEEFFGNPWDQAFVGRIKNETDKANIDLGQLYEQAQRQHSSQSII